MNYKAFKPEIWDHIHSAIAQIKIQQSAGQKFYAAFDADGTLWDTDLGENFFNYQIDHQLVKLPPAAFDHYSEMKKINNDPRSAYVWLAQINAGQKLETVRQWGQEAFETIKPSPLFSEQRKLIDLLQNNNVQIYIVTASIKWAVEPGATALGLTADHVIGVETDTHNGIISDKPVYPITYRNGKVEALLKRTNNQYPFLASGNSTGDLEMLQSATHLKLAVSAASRDDKLFKTENELIQHAEKNSWLSHRFI